MTREESIKKAIDTVDSIIENYYLKKFKSNITETISLLNHNFNLFFKSQNKQDLEGQLESLKMIVVLVKSLKGKVSYTDFARLTELCGVIDSEIVTLALEVNK